MALLKLPDGALPFPVLFLVRISLRTSIPSSLRPIPTMDILVFVLMAKYISLRMENIPKTISFMLKVMPPPFSNGILAMEQQLPDLTYPTRMLIQEDTVLH